MRLHPFVAALLTCCFALTAGCASQKGAIASDMPEAPSMNERRWANGKKKAAKDLGVPMEAIQGEYLSKNQYRFVGGGKEARYEFRCLMGQCYWISDVRARAEFDLNCPREQLQVLELSPNTRGVSGCDKRGTYLLLGDGSWIMNTAVTGQ